MLDTVSLRVAFGLIALCVLVLFYAVTYRSTRSAFCGWWVLSLACYLSGGILYLFDGTGAQVVANPAANALGVLGSALVWAATASLAERRLPLTWLVVPALVVLAVSALDDPGHDTWAGGPFYLAAMALYFLLVSRDLGRLWVTRPRDALVDSAYQVALMSMLVSSALVAVLYSARWVLFLAVGPDAALFRDLVGSQITTLILMVLLVTVTFNMTALAQSQQTRDLQLAARQDPLTGLLNRPGFHQRAAEVIRVAAPRRAVYVVMSDFDDFKLLNDHYGHPAGDAALAAFGAACRAELYPSDVAARFGGDEFALLLWGRSGRTPEETLAAISLRLATGAAQGAHAHSSVSFGVAELDRKAGLDAALARADSALYQAKRTGFGNVVRAD
ncbi:diguanylate cyclase (GGDEF) domain-containing protein [Nocardioides terrae]|uniref:Diguanylate cyclase (GGDEF) domain-containing protein n=1 Tax=Nocardioides terrae TaxID=574651 RepID=A0A1I1NX19_9ACTN|nr:GGDEF domain-containing protein [Nocardioides terrae]SFC99263.1 diguanylate cyclase (GGDEF) domain-containing protein [Nocardioides terrae]